MKPNKMAAMVCLVFGLLTAGAADDTVSRRYSEKLVDLFDLEPRVGQITEMLLQLEVKNDPEVAHYTDIYRQYFAETLGWDKLKPELAELLRQEFSSSELRSLVTFFDSEVGRKYMLVSSSLPAKISVITDRLLRAKATELQSRIKKRRADLVRRELDKIK